MSLKIHFSFLHLDFFPLNCGDVNDEHGERFHQDVSVMEHKYKGKWSAAKLGDRSTIYSYRGFDASTYLGYFFRVPPFPLHPRKFELYVIFLSYSGCERKVVHSE